MIGMFRPLSRNKSTLISYTQNAGTGQRIIFSLSRLGHGSDDEIGGVNVFVIVVVGICGIVIILVVVFVVVVGVHVGLGGLVVDRVEGVLDGDAQNGFDVVNHGDEIRITPE